MVMPSSSASRATSPPISSASPPPAAALPPSKYQFSESFWGEKAAGFEVLCSNLKHSLANVKDLEAYLRECASCEDTYVKSLNKLVAQANKYSSSNGTFTPVWSPLKEINERHAASHLQLVHNLQELIKEIQRYNEDLGKRIKKIRENETQTQNVVQAYQEASQQLNKAKDQYQNLCIEFDKQRRLLDPFQLAQYQQLSQQQQQQSSTNLLAGVQNQLMSQSNPAMLTSTTSSSAVFGPNSNNLGSNNSPSFGTDASGTVGGTSAAIVPAATSSASDRLTSLATSITANKVSQVAKLEKKVKLALDDYKSCIEKYNTIRVDFERKLADSCNHFQYAEETHLKQMRSFVDAYSKLLASLNASKTQIYGEFCARLSEQYTVDYLVQVFVENRRTGGERPEPAQFVDVVSAQNMLSSQVAQQPNLMGDTDFNLLVNPSLQSQQKPGVDLIDNRGSTFDLFNPPLTATSTTNGIAANTTNNQQRATPVFFSVSNLNATSQAGTTTAGPYSQFTNAASMTTLNAINGSGSGGASSSPINFQQMQQTHSSVTSPVNLPVPESSVSQTNTTKRSDVASSKSGLNIFNVDFLGRNKNKEKKKAAAAAAAAASSAVVPTIAADTGTISKSKFSRNKKAKQQQSTSALPTTATAQNQYETLNLTNASGSIGGGGVVGLSMSANSNRDSSSINSEDSSEHASARTMKSDSNLATNVKTPPLLNKAPSLMLDPPPGQHLAATNPMNGGSITARSISSITGSLSFDLLDQLKLANGGSGGDIDSEGFSIRPDSSVDLRQRRKNINDPSNNGKNNDDMNNLYGTSSTDSDSDDSDSENGSDSVGGPVKVMLKIKPKSELDADKQQLNNNADVLREISKNLQLKPPGLANSMSSGGTVSNRGAGKKRTYYYNYGTANPDQATSGWSKTSSGNLMNNGTDSSSLATPVNEQPPSSILGTTAGAIGRSMSVGNVQLANPNYASTDLFSTEPSTNFNNLNLKKTTAGGSETTTSSTSGKISAPLLDFDFSFGGSSTLPNSLPSAAAAPASLSSSSSVIPPPLPPHPSLTGSMSLSKMNSETNSNLYNIEEDKEVESSFQYGQANLNALIRKSASVVSPPSMSMSGLIAPPPSSNSSREGSNYTPGLPGVSNGGRFTPACFPGRTTPDFRHTTSFFEQQGTRASIISPLTINGGSEIIPIAISFNETIHAYFKLGDPTASKFKVKCFGCMKISFPFAILKLLAIELPQLEFRLSQLHIANQDLKVNQQLLNRCASNKLADLFSSPVPPSLSSAPGSPLNQSFSSSLGSSIASASNSDSTYEFKFVTPSLIAELKQQHQQNKQAAFFNFELLKYEFKYAQTPPLTLNAQWTCNGDDASIELVLDYGFKFRKQLSQVNFMIVMPTEQSGYRIRLAKSEPNAQVQDTTTGGEKKSNILWQMSSINANGRVTAKFLVNSILDDALAETKPVSVNVLEKFYQPIYTKFHIDNETLSQVKLEILTPSYKLSLLKERTETGKYFCNYDQQQQQQHPASSVNNTSTPVVKEATPTPTPSVPAKRDIVTTEAVKLETNNPVVELPPIEKNETVSSESKDQQQPDQELSNGQEDLNLTSSNSQKKPPLSGTMSTQIGSGVDVLLIC